MADSKISALSAVTVIGATDDLYVAVGGVSNRITGANAKIAFCPPYAKVADQKAQNTQGGAFNTGSWVKRTLNTEVTDTDGILTLASDQVTLLAGTYICRIRCPVWAVHYHTTRLYNSTDAAVVLTGSNMYCASGSTNESVISGQFTIAASKALQVEHRCSATKAVDGLGIGTNFQTETYAEAEFWKVG